MTRETDELSLSEYINVLRRRAPLILLTTLVFGLVGFLWSTQQTRLYEGEVEVLVDFDSSAQYVDPNRGQVSLSAIDRARLIENEVRFAAGQTVLGKLEDRLGYEPEVDTSAETGAADVIRFTAKSASAEAAATEANEYARIYIEARAQKAVTNYGDASRAIDNVLNELRGQLGSLAAQAPSASDPNVAARQSIESQIKFYETQKTALDVSAQVSRGGGTTIITPAEVPESPISPRPARTAALAGVLGLLFGVGLGFLRDYLDDTIRTPEELERTARGIPLLGAIPVDRAHARLNPTVADQGHLEEPFRSLRTSFQFMSLRTPLRALQVTSAGPAEGKSTVAAHLAVALAHAGERVLLLDADLRKPTLHHRFGLSNEVGLSSVMLRHVPLDEAIVTVAELPRLRLLPSGPLPGNPADILWSAGSASGGVTFPEIIAELTAHGYLIVVDSPPVLPVADALTLSRMVDGSLLVVAAGRTGSRDLERAVEQLRQVDARIIGLAFNTLSDRHGYGHYRYGYGTRPRTPRQRWLERLLPGRRPARKPITAAGSAASNGAFPSIKEATTSVPEGPQPDFSGRSASELSSGSPAHGGSGRVGPPAIVPGAFPAPQPRANGCIPTVPATRSAQPPSPSATSSPPTTPPGPPPEEPMPPSAPVAQPRFLKSGPGATDEDELLRRLSEHLAITERATGGPRGNGRSGANGGHSLREVRPPSER